ncbi:hypothetical protein HGRIS_002252 [Hohenbuehelia grisea]|uniref:Tyrosine specific protein phosphatases domain-containing protein n=1 Tax=Hohenbuehelia grisea TaxID=104357 RepID=A0ABR3JL38_9AGAR
MHLVVTEEPSPQPAHPYHHQIAVLASQHHASEYSRAKFGPQGCSAQYAPLSIYMPEHFQDLRHRQESYECPAWWPSSSPSSSSDPENLEPTVNDDALVLQQELSSAIATPLDFTPEICIQPLPQAQIPALPVSVKTSESHPINISFVIPSELLPLISSHLVLSSFSLPNCPIFELAPPFFLDRLIAARPPCNYNSHPSTISSFPVKAFPILWLPNSSHTVSLNDDKVLGRASSAPRLPVRTRSNMGQAMQAAMSSGLAVVSPLPSSSSSQISETRLSRSPYRSNLGFKSSGDHASTLMLHHSNASSLSLSLSLSLSVSTQQPSVDLNLDVCTPPPLEVPAFVPDTLPRSQTPIVGAAPSSSRISVATSTEASPFSVGNLLMSSCPGKKVRLNGPTKGRSAVCRDLDTDLRRIRDLGVRCIVCCLDDAELEFLGAPWSAYQDAAGAAGLDVLRIPMPEGLPPLTPEALDSRLTELIERYTLRGIHVLVHCRGGVGRAGVVACCWIIKLGLCGWVHEEDEHDHPPDSVRPGTLRLVERVIALLRQRRSIKAVETYEQVQFMVEYVEYLRQGFGAHISCTKGGRLSF